MRGIRFNPTHSARAAHRRPATPETKDAHPIHKAPRRHQRDPRDPEHAGNRPADRQRAAGPVRRPAPHGGRRRLGDRPPLPSQAPDGRLNHGIRQRLNRVGWASIPSVLGFDPKADISAPNLLGIFPPRPRQRLARRPRPGQSVCADRPGMRGGIWIGVRTPSSAVTGLGFRRLERLDCPHDGGDTAQVGSHRHGRCGWLFASHGRGRICHA